MTPIGRNGQTLASLRHKRVNQYRYRAHMAKVWGNAAGAAYWTGIVNKLLSLYGMVY